MWKCRHFYKSVICEHVSHILIKMGILLLAGDLKNSLYKLKKMRLKLLLVIKYKKLIDYFM